MKSLLLKDYYVTKSRFFRCLILVIVVIIFNHLNAFDANELSGMLLLVQFFCTNSILDKLLYSDNDSNALDFWLSAGTEELSLVLSKSLYSIAVSAISMLLFGVTTYVLRTITNFTFNVDLFEVLYGFTVILLYIFSSIYVNYRFGYINTKYCSICVIGVSFLTIRLSRHIDSMLTIKLIVMAISIILSTICIWLSIKILRDRKFVVFQKV